MRALVKKVMSRTFGLEVHRRGFWAKPPGGRRGLRHPAPSLLLKSTVRRLMYFYELLQKVQDIEGDVVECGVGEGRGLFGLVILSDILGRQRQFYGFDTFQGFPDPSVEDNRATNLKEFSYPPRREVLQYLLNCGVDADFIDTQITLVEGLFSATLPDYSGRPIAFLHLDCDIYQSYMETLRYLYPHVVTGGIIAFDEYYTKRWPGAKIAIDEFFADKEERLVDSSAFYRHRYTVKK